MEKMKMPGILIFILIMHVLALNHSTAQVYSSGSLSPVNWTPEQWEMAGRTGTGTEGAATGRKHMLINTGMPEAAYAGFTVLEQGGNAMDAALTAALADITIKTGNSVSFAGFMNLVYYDAKTGKVHGMNAGWNTPLEEKDPMSIPDYGSEIPSGRTTLVPGFMAGLGEAHQKFGKLPFAALFEPSIYFAEEGVVVSPRFEWFISWQGKYIGRLPEAREIFTDENGEWLKAGDTLRQAALATTLRKVAEEGADYMYTGDWAKGFVEAVQREGGKLTMQDLAQYDVLWEEPVHTRYRDFDVYGVAPPNTGGVNTVEALSVLAQADLQQFGHYSESADALFYLLRAGRLPYILGTSFTNEPIDPELSNQYIPNISMDLSDRATEQHAKALYEAIRGDAWNRMIAVDTAAGNDPGNGHSDGIVAIDSDGNMAAIVHTCNTAAWGRSGIFVDGVSIPDAGGAGNQEQMARVGPGNRLYEATPPIAVLKDGKPFLISSSIAMGVHEYTVQNLVNVLEYGMDPFEASQAPHFGVPLLQMGESMELAKDFLPPLGVELESPHVQVAAEGTFDQKLLEKVRAMGEPLQEVPAPWFNMATGMWIGIQVDPQTGLLQGTTVDSRSGGAHGE